MTEKLSCSHCGCAREPRPGAGPACSNCGNNGFPGEAAPQRYQGEPRPLVVEAIAEEIRWRSGLLRYTQARKPTVDCLEARLGYDITAAERDAGAKQAKAQGAS